MKIQIVKFENYVIFNETGAQALVSKDTKNVVTEQQIQINEQRK